MGKQAPSAPNYQGAARAQSAEGYDLTKQANAANRPNQTNAFGSSVTWGFDANGNPTQQQSFGGGVGQYADNLQQQLGEQQPVDWAALGKLGDGSDAVETAYTQATARLNPEWDRRETAMRSRLANQGLDPNSEAARVAQSQFDQGRNDAYGQARLGAIQAGDSVFRNNLASRQQMLAEALRRHGMPLEEMRAMQGLLGQQDFMGSMRADPTQYLTAAGMQGNAELQRWAAQNQANADLFGGFMDLAGSAGTLYGL